MCDGGACAQAVTWPVEAATGWGTLSRALLARLLARGYTPLLAVPLAQSAHMSAALTPQQLAAMTAHQRVRAC